MVTPMNRIVILATLGSLVGVAAGQPKPKKEPLAPATIPVVGETLAVTGAATWPKVEWLYDVPSATDAAGKVMVHWFCGPKVKTCVDDLARIVTLKENGRVYVVAHINGTKRDAQKLDPIRESEGVGRGTVAFGRGTITLMKQLAITGPASIVVDVDGKVALVSTGGSPAELDARDAKVTALVGAIKEYAMTSAESPKGIKPGDKFTLSITIKLASWLKYSQKTPTEFTLTAPPDFKCDAKALKGDQLKIDRRHPGRRRHLQRAEGHLRGARRAALRLRDPHGQSGIGDRGREVEVRGQAVAATHGLAATRRPRRARWTHLRAR